MEVTIYNPALDEDGRAGRELTNILVDCAWNLGALDPQSGLNSVGLFSAPSLIAFMSARSPRRSGALRSLWSCGRQLR